MTKLSLERFEGRINMSGFGPEDGAMIVETGVGGYDEVRIDASGGILAAGKDNNAASALLAHYNSLGEVDAGYGVAGRATPALGTGTESANGLVLQADGKAVISYYRTDGASNLLHGAARLLANGTVDTSYGTGGFTTFDVRTNDAIGLHGAAALQSTGKMVTAQASSVILPTGTPGWSLVGRFTTSGALDSGKNAFGKVQQGKSLGYAVVQSTGTSGNNGGGFLDLDVQSDDKIVAVGKTTPTDGTNGSFTVARFTANGALDSTFSGDGLAFFTPPGATNAWARDVARQTDGKFIVAGNFRLSDGTWDLFVARVNANGTLDTSFGTAGFVTWDIDGAANATWEGAGDVVIDADGKIVVTGYSHLASNYLLSNTLVVARFGANGTPDSTFGAGGFKYVVAPDGQQISPQGVALQADGSIVVAGAYYDGVSAHPMLARFYGDSNSLMSASSNSSSTSTDKVFSSPDAGAVGAYMSGLLNSATDLLSPVGKKKK